MTWENHGVAPAYHQFDLRLQLRNTDLNNVFVFELSESNNQKWFPGRIVGENYNLTISESIPAGKYEIKIGLFDNCQKKNIPIRLALKNERRSEDGYYKMGEIIIK